MATILNQNEENETQPTTQAITSPVSGPSTVSPSQPQRQGSGRFTNIQKYINANKTAGQNLVNNVSGSIQKDIGQQKSKTDESASAVRQGIQQGQQGLNQGSQFGQQLNTIGQNIKSQTSNDQNQAFANRDVNALGIDQFDNTNYQKFQQGQNLDEVRLGLQNRNFVNQNQNLQNVAQQNLQNISSDAGRFNMIRNMFGKNINPGYTSGQQRLDTMFLSQNPLSDLRKNLTGTQQAAQQGINESQRLGQDITRMTQAERDLISGNQGVAQANTDAYLNMLGSYTGELNKQRAGEFQTLQDKLSSLKSNDFSGGLLDKTPYQKATLAPSANPVTMDRATLERLGLSSGPQQVYNVFNSLKNTDVANRGRDAANYQDVANQTDVDKFSLLSQIAKQDPSRLAKASELGAAWDSKTGSDSLQSRINQAGEQFAKEAQVIDRKSKDALGRHAQTAKRTWSVADATSLENLLKGGVVTGGDRGDLARNSYIGQPIQRGVAQSQTFAGQIFDQGLSQLGQRGYGNILNLDNPSQVQNALAGLTANDVNVDNPNAARMGLGFGEYGGDSGGAARRYTSNLDELVRARLAASGIKSKY
jgi:hypothetical protein